MNDSVHASLSLSVSHRHVSTLPHLCSLPSTKAKTHARTSTSSQVSPHTPIHWLVNDALQDGGWLKANPIPSDKGRYGNFDTLAIQNKRLLQQILSEDSSSHFAAASSLMADPYDELLLKKLRGLYQSCMDEDALNEIGEAPLKDVVKKIRELFRGKTTVVDAEKTDSEKRRERLTATVAYLHSRGKFPTTQASFVKLMQL